jgi:hypothetical protein
MAGELYERCRSCGAGTPMPGCEECDGVGFVPTGLTTHMFSDILDRLGGLKDFAESIIGLLRRGPDQRNRRNGNGDRGSPASNGGE